MVLARLAWRKYTDLYEKRVDPRGKAYYWLAGEVVEEEVDPCSDVRAVAEGYVSITPLQPDLTAYAAFDSLQQWGLSAFGSGLEGAL
jgi:5'-nucleotidase